MLKHKYSMWKRLDYFNCTFNVNQHYGIIFKKVNVILKLNNTE